MRNSEQYKVLKQDLATHLVAHGWSPVTDFDMAYTPAVATKAYESCWKIYKA